MNELGNRLRGALDALRGKGNKKESRRGQRRVTSYSGEPQQDGRAYLMKVDGQTWKANNAGVYQAVMNVLADEGDKGKREEVREFANQFLGILNGLRPDYGDRPLKITDGQIQQLYQDRERFLTEEEPIAAAAIAGNEQVLDAVVQRYLSDIDQEPVEGESYEDEIGTSEGPEDDESE